MQLVIEISEANYEYFKNTHFIADEKIVFKQSPEDRKGTMNLFRLVDAVKDGIVLPEKEQVVALSTVWNENDSIWNISEDDHKTNNIGISLPEFFNIIEKKEPTDYIVWLRIKYSHETEWEYIKEVLYLEESCNFDSWCWLNDWDEGQQDVEVLGYTPVHDIAEFRILGK